jgi:hypothetical protein
MDIYNVTWNKWKCRVDDNKDMGRWRARGNPVG